MGLEESMNLLMKVPMKVLMNMRERKMKTRKIHIDLEHKLQQRQTIIAKSANILKSTQRNSDGLKRHSLNIMGPGGCPRFMELDINMRREVV